MLAGLNAHQQNAPPQSREPAISRYLDITGWKRREHFELFRGMEQPFFSITVEVDATGLRGHCSGQDRPSFFLTALHLLLHAANDVEAFRLRIRGDRVWLHDRVDLTSTILREDDTFAFGHFPFLERFADFEEHGRAELERVKKPGPLWVPENNDGLIYHSTLPWFRFTAFTNAMDGAADSIPRVVFGRCSRNGDRWVMPVAVEVHHALVDGLDVANFLQRFQHNLDSIPEESS